MIRGLIFLLISIIAITFLRSVIGLIMRSMGDALQPQQPTETRAAASGGELKRDPVCGTYVATAVSVKKTVGKEVLHFCSAACSDRYRA